MPELPEVETVVRSIAPLVGRRIVSAEFRCRRVLRGGDKGYQEEEFIQGLRELRMVPHIAEYQTNTKWPNWLTASERDDPGFAISQCKRKLIESLFGWIKCVAGLRKTKFRGRRRVGWMFTWAAAVSNLIRLAKLIPAEA